MPSDLAAHQLLQKLREHHGPGAASRRRGVSALALAFALTLTIALVFALTSKLAPAGYEAFAQGLFNGAIAERAGVSERTIFQHFEDLDTEH